MSNMGPIRQSAPYDPGPGTGDHGETWDPTGGPNGTGAYGPAYASVSNPNDQAPSRPSSEYGNTPTDAYGNPYVSNSNAPTQGGPVNDYGQPATVGRVHGGDAAGGHNTGDAWGGYTGTNVVGPDGKVTYDASLSGRAADVNRFQDMGAQAGNTPAYQLQYGNANADAAMGNEDRARQDKAIALARDAATGKNSMAQALGRRALAQGGQMQTAGALSTRGGSLAGMSSVAGVNSSMGRYNQLGQQALKANAADEMAAGRSQYADMASTQRAGDAAAQSQNQKQAINQGGLENSQRDLNQQTQLGYEGMAQGVDEAAQKAAIDAKATAQGVDINNQQRDTRNAQADTNTMLGVAQSGGDAYKDYQQSSGKPDPNSTSDRRAKSMADFYGKRDH